MLTIQQRPMVMTAANTPDWKTCVFRIASGFCFRMSRAITAAATSMKI